MEGNPAKSLAKPVSSGGGEVRPGPDEKAVWSGHGADWHQLFGSFHELGVSFEWHEFRTRQRMDWKKSFHPQSLEVCLNLSGAGSVGEGGGALLLSERTVAFYFTGDEPPSAWREPGGVHQFVSVEFSPDFLRRNLGSHAAGLTPLVAGVVKGEVSHSTVGECRRMTSAQLDMVRALRRPPVFAPAHPAWYLGKALEVAAAFFYQPATETGLFCHRQQHVAAERVEKAMALVKENLVEPLTLEEIGKRVGCSSFYLSRTFSRETGMTLSQYLRQLRMEKAAELLRAGKHNVTEAAMEVGYNSLSHFSHAFHQTFGCCPGLYPVMNRPAAVRRKPSSISVSNKGSGTQT